MDGKTLSVAAFVGLSLLPASARAEGTACLTTGNAGPTVIVPDGRILESTIPNGVTYIYIVGITPGRSYSFESRYHKGEYNATAVTLVTTIGTGACTSPAVLNLTNTKQIDPMLHCTNCTEPQGNRRASFVADSTAIFITVQNTSAVSQSLTISMSETSLFSPAWSTNGSFDTFYSLYNTTNSTIAGTLTLFDTAGTAVSTVPISVAAGATASTNTVAAGAPRNTAGTALFIHTGPPGAILAEAAIGNFSISPTPYIQIVKFGPVRESAH
jgi:hypothetical protein